MAYSILLLSYTIFKSNFPAFAAQLTALFHCLGLSYNFGTFCHSFFPLIPANGAAEILQNTICASSVCLLCIEFFVVRCPESNKGAP